VLEVLTNITSPVQDLLVLVNIQALENTLIVQSATLMLLHRRISLCNQVFVFIRVQAHLFLDYLNQALQIVEEIIGEIVQALFIAQKLYVI
jgi:hypothetical protein